MLLYFGTLLIISAADELSKERFGIILVNMTHTEPAEFLVDKKFVRTVMNFLG